MTFADTVICGEVWNGASHAWGRWPLELRCCTHLQHLMFQHVRTVTFLIKKKTKKPNKEKIVTGLLRVWFVNGSFQRVLTLLPKTWINGCSLPVLLFSVPSFQLIFDPHPHSTVKFLTHKYVFQRMRWSSMLTSFNLRAAAWFPLLIRRSDLDCGRKGDYGL